MTENNWKRFVKLTIPTFLLVCFSFSFCAHKSFGIEPVNDLSFDFYSQENGLSNNQIHCILQDKKSWMWFGTSKGVCRFDGYKFNVFKNDPEDSTSLKGDLVRTIFEDRKGQLWIGTENGGLNKFNREKEYFEHLFYSGNQAILKDATVTSIYEDSSDAFWVGTENSLYRMENETKLSLVKPSNQTIFSEYFRVIQSDKSGRIWLGTNKGLFIYNPTNNQVQKIDLPKNKLADQEIWSIFVDDDGLLWIGTYAGGVFTVNPLTLEIKHLILDPDNGRSLTVRAISKDRSGKYWIGTRGGLYMYEKDKGVTAFYCHDDREPKSLVNNSIQYIYHDLKGDVWIGTRNGINFLIEERQNIQGFKSMTDDPRYLNSSEVYAFWINPEGDIWVGTENGGINILNRKTGHFKYMLPQNGNPNSLSVSCIKALLDDGKGNLWIGTFLGGIDVLNLKTGKFKHFKNDPANPTSLSDNRVWSLMRDSNNDIWVGTTVGVDKFDLKSETFVHFGNLVNNRPVNWLAEDSDHLLWFGSEDLIIYNPQNQKTTRIKETTRYMFQDSKKRIWLATFNRGIALYTKEKGIVRYYSEKNELANDQALTIQEDNEHFLWISTTNGLSKFDPETERFHNYSLKNGFLNNQFLYGAAYKSAQGELLFGCISGFNIFNPTKIQSNDYFPPIVLTDLKIFNKSVKIGSKRNDILIKSISETEKITLNYDQNSISLDFASFDFSNSLGLQYSYFLEGFDKDWNELSVNRTATYTNLEPAEYTFRVKTVSIDSKESNQGAVLRIVVRPPFWKTWWFRILALLSIGLAIYIAYYLKLKIYRDKEKELSILVEKRTHELTQANKILIERQTLIEEQSEELLAHSENLKTANNLLVQKQSLIQTQAATIRDSNDELTKLNATKDRIFSIIAHDLRNPFNVAIGFSDILLEEYRNLPPETIEMYLNYISDSSKSGNTLLDNLLQWSRTQTGGIKFEPIQLNLLLVANETCNFLQGSALKKKINIQLQINPDISVLADVNMLKTILRNLISNAIKFTNENGIITVYSSQKSGHVEVCVSDSGVGVPEEKLPLLFNIETNKSTLGTSQESGTGLGLILCKDFVEKHNGKIWVESKIGEGSQFKFTMPLS
jgi:ligand-binding sensor domain-containing protein/signal transduction histidine kinase